MRITLVNHSRRRIGGAEVYLDSVMNAIARAGHEISCLCEDDTDYADRELIRLPADSPTWCTGSLGLSQALAQLAAWRPDVCFSHGLHRPELEAQIVDGFPSVLYVHNYYGTCISGTKTHNTATPTCCERRFGAACLLQYFPTHCGGSNPLTMWQLYRLQSQRLAVMGRYRALIANSDYIARELGNHGLTSNRVYYPLRAPVQASTSAPAIDDEVRLVFAARMTSLKGGQYLLAALPDVQRRLQKRIHLTMAGDGPDRSAWEKLASSINSNSISIAFPGWLGAAGLAQMLSQSHLLVYPSIWPEPFGLSGLEAGLHGVPSVAFAVGGIPEWLHDGVNGHLASIGTQPLADAIVHCLADPKHYEQLRAGACRRAQEYTLDAHLAQLLLIFERAAR